MNHPAPGPSCWACSNNVLPVWVVFLSLFCPIHPGGSCGVRTSLCCSVDTEDTEPQPGQIFCSRGWETGPVSVCQTGLYTSLHSVLEQPPPPNSASPMEWRNGPCGEQAESWQGSIANIFACYGLDSTNTNTLCSPRLRTPQTAASNTNRNKYVHF